MDIDILNATFITNNFSSPYKPINKHINLTKTVIKTKTKPTTEKENITKKKNKIKKQINLWSGRILSLNNLDLASPNSSTPPAVPVKSRNWDD